MYELSRSKEFCAEIRDFVLQLIQNPLSFTACGFFNLDYTLLNSIIGTIATYVIILMQFGRIPLEDSIKNSTLAYNDV
ncbi:hypothetical protein M0804_011230 [Polistes exclamans]|nr:hypothetical protein M0804_011230 [Polistes exclamans]